MQKKPYQILSGVGIFLSICGIIIFMLQFMGMDFDFDYLYSSQKSELEQYFIETRKIIESTSLIIAIIGCCLCLLCSLILRSIGLMLESIRTEYCQGCDKPFDKLKLKKIDSGQRLCLDCIRSLKK